MSLYARLAEEKAKALRAQSRSGETYVCVQQVTPDFDSNTGLFRVTVGGAYRATVYVDPDSPVTPDDVTYVDGVDYNIYVAPLGYDTKTGDEYVAIVATEIPRYGWEEGFFMFLAKLVGKYDDYKEAQRACHLA